MTKGTVKKKIDVKKIASDSSRKVTFSKRRTGVFKKAQELETKSGAQIALLVFSPSGRLYTSSDVSLFENNAVSSKPQLSTEIASNSYVKPSILRLKNLNVEGCSEIFSPASIFYSASEIPIVEDNLKNNGFSSNSDLSTDFSSNFYEDWSTLWLGNFDDEECSEIFSPPDGFYSSDWSCMWLENFNVEECSSVEELMLLKEKLEENRDGLILKMEAEFIESLLV
ncbi:hypothetical protein RDI58_001435 [Solanum bulbocastanum]|uniref:MADS-box domain-containing protein n=1 Tax=Solanum bulbocastanum TaxID=147425 RepID=A0AAN8UCN8_SOLBU